MQQQEARELAEMILDQDYPRETLVGRIANCLVEALEIERLKTEPAFGDTSGFIEALVSLCKKNGAVIFPRKDSARMYVSVQVADVWLDFRRVSGDGTEV